MAEETCWIIFSRKFNQNWSKNSPAGLFWTSFDLNFLLRTGAQAMTASREWSKWVYPQGGIHSPIAKIQSKLVPNRPAIIQSDLQVKQGDESRPPRREGGTLQSRERGHDAEKRGARCREEMQRPSRIGAESREGGTMQKEKWARCREERGERGERGARCREERRARCREERGTMQRRQGHDAEGREGHDAARIEGHDAETFEEIGGHEGREELLHAPWLWVEESEREQCLCAGRGETAHEHTHRGVEGVSKGCDVEGSFVSWTTKNATPENIATTT
jgi:hypothetical protein